MKKQRETRKSWPKLACEHCGKSCKGAQGLSLHTRRVHPAMRIIKKGAMLTDNIVLGRPVAGVAALAEAREAKTRETRAGGTICDALERAEQAIREVRERIRLLADGLTDGLRSPESLNTWRS